MTSFGQFQVWYRKAKKGEEQDVPQVTPTISIATPDDLPCPLEHSSLPSVIILVDGTVMRKLQQPRALDYGPSSAYAEILLFKVGNISTC